MSDHDFDTAIIDRAALALASELEKTTICDIVADLLKRQLPLEKPSQFWGAAASELAKRNFTRRAIEVQHLFDLCHQEGREVVNVRRYIESKTRKVTRGEEAMAANLTYPDKAPDHMAPDFVNEEERKRLQSLAAGALAMLKEPEESGEKMSFRGKDK